MKQSEAVERMRKIWPDHLSDKVDKIDSMAERLIAFTETGMTDDDAEKLMRVTLEIIIPAIQQMPQELIDKIKAGEI